MSQITSTSDLRTLTGNGGGGPVSPLNGNITLVGGAGIAVTGNQAAHTITISNTGAEASFFQADFGSAVPIGGIVNLNGPIGGNISTTGSGNTIDFAVSGTNNHSVQVGTAAGALRSITVGNDGEILIGKGGADPKFAAVTSSNGSITINGGPNTLDLTVTAGGIAWSSVNVDTAMLTNHGYITEGAVQLLMALPLVSAVGDEIKIVDSGNAGTSSPWRITTAGLQSIFAAGNEVTGFGGYVEVVGGNTAAEFSSITLRCVTANKFWVVESAVADLNFV